MSDSERPSNDDPQTPGRLDRIPRKSFVELMPTRNLVRAAVLLALLLGIVTFQRRSGQLGKMIAETLFPPPPARPATESTHRTAPTVRMAPPQPMPSADPAAPRRAP